MAKEKISGVYKIENIINGKLYIGSSINIYKRWGEHKRLLRINKHHSYKLQNAWNKYGKNNFKFEIIKVFNGKIDELRKLEQYYLDLFNSFDLAFGYNVNNNALGTGSHPFTYDDISKGKSTISKEQFDEIIYYLCNTNISMPKISEITGVNHRSIYEIYCKENYTNIVKDMDFIQRKNCGEDSNNNKLTENQVQDIIFMLLDNKYITDIARKFNVNSQTIRDIYHYKTWKHLTENIVFPKYEEVYKDPKKQVVQYDLDGNFIAEFESEEEASRVTGIGSKMISRVCKEKRLSTHGYIWRFAS